MIWINTKNVLNAIIHLGCGGNIMEERKKCSSCYYAQNGVCLNGDSPKYGKLLIFLFKPCEYFSTAPHDGSNTDSEDEQK